MNCYYPIMFEKDVIINKPHSFTLLNKNYVLWKNKNGYLSCVIDKCGHRSAKLSQGKIVNNTIECGYHGWLYDGMGVCKKIPQIPNSQVDSYKIPRSCNINFMFIKEYDNILWVDPYNTKQSQNYLKTIPKWNNQELNLITDKMFDTTYNYAIQIENLLDPAHVHFVHDGFQGKKDNASAIFVKNIIKNDKIISADFIHENKNVPFISIKFYIPSIVEVSIYNKNKNIIRKNVIYVVPTEKGKCRVLFRDIAVKKYLTPEDNIIIRENFKLFVDIIAKEFVESHYELINTEVVNSIMKQDIEILNGQVSNIQNYIQEKYVLPTESDKLIIEFRKWLKNVNNNELLI